MPSWMTPSQAALWRFALNTVALSPNINTLQHTFWQTTTPSAQCYFINTLTAALSGCCQIHQWRFAFHTHPTPMQCSTHSGKLQHPLLSATLQTRLTAALWYCKYTCGDLLSIQVCTHPTPKHCITDSGKLQHPLLSGPLQTRLIAALWHCKYTSGGLLSILVCTHPTPKHCNKKK